MILKKCGFYPCSRNDATKEVPIENTTTLSQLISDIYAEKRFYFEILKEPKEARKTFKELENCITLLIEDL